MTLSPDFLSFQERYDKGEAQIVSQSLVADLDTAVSAYLKLSENETYSLLLESVTDGAVKGRYSIIGIRPDIIWKSDNGVASINRNALESSSFESVEGNSLESLRSLLKESVIDLPTDLPPMAAGIIGYLGYDMVREMEDLAPAKPDPIGIPTGMFIRPTIMAIFDDVTNMITVVTPVRPHAALSAEKAHEDATSLLSQYIKCLKGPLPKTKANKTSAPINIQSNTSKTDYAAMVKTAQDYILAGDIFQVVLSQRFSTAFTLPPFSLYRALRRTNPSPFMYHLAFDNFAIVGSSPEVLVRLSEGEITIRPIAGTRKRGATMEEDLALEKDLLADPKECSEHLMLLDLGRNDIGRVAAPHTVKVTAQNTIERYSHVMHIVSNVVGKLDAKYDAIDALRAGFPAGTVSGAPKVRAMEIIDSLEKERRGPYAGSVGYFSASGTSMDTAIVLRTAVIKDEVLHVQAGAGIVADSVAEAEQQECENKAQALVRAAEEAIHIEKING